MYSRSHALITTLNTTFISALLGFATNASAADSVMDVLKPYYPLYNKALKCHGVIAPSGSVNGLTNEPYMTGYCIDIDRQQVVKTDKGKRLYVLVTGDVSFDENGKKVSDSRFFNGLVGMFVLKPKGNSWAVESANSTINAGSLGFGLRNWRLQQFAPYTWGFSNKHSTALQGYYSDQIVILIPDKTGIKESWIGANYNNEDAGKCEDDMTECDNVETTFAIDDSKIINEFHPLEFTLNGLVQGKTYKNITYRINYQQDKGYVQPNNYPLKDNY